MFMLPTDVSIVSRQASSIPQEVGCRLSVPPYRIEMERLIRIVANEVGRGSRYEDHVAKLDGGGAVVDDYFCASANADKDLLFVGRGIDMTRGRRPRRNDTVASPERRAQAFPWQQPDPVQSVFEARPLILEPPD
jgi:hypothetical protein